MWNSAIRLCCAGYVLSTCWLLAAESDGQFLPEVKVLQPGVALTLLAEHPDLVTPTGIDVDAQGQIWAVATHTHFRPEGYQGPEQDEVLVFQEDQGRAVHRRVFYNATKATMDLELGPDGWVYLAERSRILRVKDTNGDGRGDLEETIALLSTEADYPHNGLEGIAWHPNGDLVFGLGDNMSKPWTLTGTDGAGARGIGEGGIFRCRPDGSGLRRIARGFWNPFGVCVRADGEVFTTDNDPGERPPCRLLHVVEGGDYGYLRQYGSASHHPFVCWHGELPGTLPMIHPTGEAPCGVLPLGGGLIVPSWTDNRIDFYPLRRKGASFTAERVVLLEGGHNFRPVCIAPGTANAKSITFYFTDWVFVSYQLHGKGRLWKLEIDPQQAKWFQPREVEPPTAAAVLAAQLRSSDGNRSRAELFQLAHDADPFIANAAIGALSRQAATWQPQDVQRLSAADRPLAVLALKLAADVSTWSAAEDADGKVRRPPVASDSWVRQLLQDDDPGVRFETLRWISNAQLREFLPDVKALLDRSDLDYRQFEACVATWNTLTGKPEDGIRNSELLLSRSRDASSAPQLRAFALRLLPTLPTLAPASGAAPTTQFPKGLDLALLQELLNVGDETLSLEAVRTLGGNPTPAAQEILAQVAAQASHTPRLRAEAVAALSAVPDGHLELFIQLAHAGERPVREEALRALRQTNLSADQLRRISSLEAEHPESLDLVRAVVDPPTLTQGRPPVTDVAAWQQRLAAVQEPPDAESGGRTFHHARLGLCSRCHRHGGRGNVVGPDLGEVARPGERSWLLESVLQPSLKVAPEYRARTLILKDGRTFTGILLRGSDTEVLRDSNGQERRFKLDDIESRSEILTSLMPDGLVNSLTDRELRDLLVYLETSGSSAAGP